MTTIFDPRTLTTRKHVVRPFDKLESFVTDMVATCLEIEEQIADEAFRSEDPACIRDAEVLAERLEVMVDALMEFQREYVG